LGFVIEQTTRKIDEKHAKTQFIMAWTPTIVEMGDIFTMIFKQVFKYIDTSTRGESGYTTWAQQQIRVLA
jgi:hypothetical protein